MSFTPEQVDQLLKPINPKRVLTAQGMSHVSQQDVRAHLIRIFGFDGWDKEILDLRCVRDEAVILPPKRAGGDPRHVQAVTYLCRLRLTIRDPQGNVVKVAEDVGTGTSPNLPDYGDAHDFAAKNAVSYALKRCATDLGDQFGLSLYNKGQTSALVGGVIVHPERNDSARGDVQADVPQQVDLGDERPAEHVDTATGEVTSAPEPPPADEVTTLKREVWKVGQEQRLTGPQLAEMFSAFTEGGELAKAQKFQLTSFLDYLTRPLASNGTSS